MNIKFTKCEIETKVLRQNEGLCLDEEKKRGTR